jgi:hypothetical protein
MDVLNKQLSEENLDFNFQVKEENFDQIMTQVTNSIYDNKYPLPQNNQERKRSTNWCE